MAPATPKTSFKSYEVQARLLRAIVAAHPEVKWNYKEICIHYGSDLSGYSLQHHFRRLKTQAEIIRLGLVAGFDPKDIDVVDTKFPKDQNGIDKGNIAKYFGESTADGIQFQFRAIKKDAAAMRTAITTGSSPIKALTLTTPSTTRRRPASTGTSTPKTPSASSCILPSIAETGISSALGNMTVKKEFLGEDADREPDPEATPTRPRYLKKKDILGKGRKGDDVHIKKEELERGLEQEQPGVRTRQRSGLSVSVSPEPDETDVPPATVSTSVSRQAKKMGSGAIDLTEISDSSEEDDLPPLDTIHARKSSTRTVSPFKSEPAETFYPEGILSSSQETGNSGPSPKKRRRTEEEDSEGGESEYSEKSGNGWNGGVYQRHYMGGYPDEDGAI